MVLSYVSLFLAMAGSGLTFIAGQFIHDLFPPYSDYYAIALLFLPIVVGMTGAWWFGRCWKCGRNLFESPSGWPSVVITWFYCPDCGTAPMDKSK